MAKGASLDRIGIGIGIGATGHQASATKDSRHELDVLKSKVWQISCGIRQPAARDQHARK